MSYKLRGQKISGIPYKTKYSQIRDHLDFFLLKALEDVYLPLTIEEIKERLNTASSIRLSERTLKKDLNRFSRKYGESLLCQIGDRYRLNHCLYKYMKIKPPRGYAESD